MGLSNSSAGKSWRLKWRRASLSAPEVVLTETWEGHTITHSSLAAPYPTVEILARKNSLLVTTKHDSYKLAFTTPRQAKEIAHSLQAVQSRQEFVNYLYELQQWHTNLAASLAGAKQRQCWVTSEDSKKLWHTRPRLDSDKLKQFTQQWASSIPSPGYELLLYNTQDFAQEIVDTNNAVFDHMHHTYSELFETIEKWPLSLEQKKAAACFDNRVFVNAAAGSGKTSVMVARAALAIKAGIAPGDGILLVAFNKSAAEELRSRVDAAFDRLGLDSSAITVATFHSLGLDILARHQGYKPEVADWCSGPLRNRALNEIVEGICKTDLQFKERWELFCLLFHQPAPDGRGEDFEVRGLYPTYAGGWVRSYGEQIIANWLYLNHVDYVYEKAYPFVSPSRKYRQYRPDFYYPKSDTWHEHWALDFRGKPPASWTEYLPSLRWKQRAHKEHKTDLIETTWARVMSREDLVSLDAALEQRGHTLRWDPERKPKRRSTHSSFDHAISLLSTVLQQVKATGSTPESTQYRLKRLAPNQVPRVELFLSILWPVLAQWNERLQNQKAVDFEDMVAKAGSLLSTGSIDLGFTMVLVDEFQDISADRLKLLQGLLAKPGRHLLAVGDDWQSINRFAGADPALLSSFSHVFGSGVLLPLETTYRCHQSIANVASHFVTKNPEQLSKNVMSVHTTPPRPQLWEGVHLVYLPPSVTPQAALAGLLVELNETPHPLSVDVLGRYNKDKRILEKLPAPKKIHLTFRTIHTAKGLEADYVCLPFLSKGKQGFPSEIKDDPLLTLFSPSVEGFEFAEERRILYVALTRARKGVVIFSSSNNPSSFAVELEKTPGVTVHGSRKKKA